VTVSPDDALLYGIPETATADGYRIVFERFLVVLGQASLDGDACEAYSDAGYDRIFDMQRAEPQRVSISYGIGRCAFGFGISSPAWDTLRGSGVTEGDEAMLRTSGTDLHSDGGGVSVYVEGVAERFHLTKRFAWSFRRFIVYEACSAPSSDGTEHGILLEPERKSGVDIAIRGEPLFQDDVDDSRAVLRFDPFRQADDEFGNADGVITLDELQRTPISFGARAVLGDHVYLDLLPLVARFRETGNCTIHASAERRGGWGGP
jgi:hypothetical protein